MNINTLINKEKKNFDLFFKKILKSHLSKGQLSKAMYYGSMNGGKRIRPFLINIFSNIARVKKSYSLMVCTAVESIHSYSLIHDDLPSMDNDDFRRGKLSTHKKFNEATAILAGDALHDFAFEILSDKKTHPDFEKRIKLIKRLSIALGHRGLAGGQSLDLIFENKDIKTSNILKMYEMKTSSLFSFSCSAPYILAESSRKEIKFAEEFGNLFGLIFQITDDIIDEEKNFKYLGKTPGKDKKQGKSTLISNTNKDQLKKYCLSEIYSFRSKYLIYFKDYPILNDLLKLNMKRIN